MRSHFLIFLIYAVVFECSSLEYLAPKRVKHEKCRVRGGEEWVLAFFKSPGSHSSQRRSGLQQTVWGGVPTMAAYLFSVIRSRDVWRAGSFLPTLATIAVCELL